MPKTLKSKEDIARLKEIKIAIMDCSKFINDNKALRTKLKAERNAIKAKYKVSA